MKRLIEALDHPAWLFSAEGDLVADNAAARRRAAGLGPGGGAGGDAGGGPGGGAQAGGADIAARLRAAVDAVRLGAGPTPIGDGAPGDETRIGEVDWLNPDDPAAGILAQLAPGAAADGGADGGAGEGAGGGEDARARALEAELDAMRRQLAGFRNMADSAPGAVYERVDTTDGRWIYTYHSAGMPDLFGVTAEAVAQDGRAVFRNIDPAEVREIAAKAGAARQSGEQFELVMNVAHPERGPRSVLLSTQPFPQPDGSTVWYGDMADITAQKAAERRAAQAAADARRA
ncbi:hypothetical protein ACQ5SO_02335 [Rhodovulum sp. DZ06]|uniref:hypothetical protein n=1 Tax=Rhodovulum sp. DZ06 TaxID=3425126 RepID=UPI003D34ACAD